MASETPQTDGADAPEPRKKRGPARAVNARRPPPLQERLEFYGVMAIVALLAPFPPKWKGRFAAAVGRVIGPRRGVSRRAHANFDLARPDYDAATRARVVREACANFARAAVEYLYLPAIRRAARDYPTAGLEHLAAAREANGGRLIVASAHYGNWEGVRAVAAEHGAPLSIIYRAFNNKRVDDYFYGRIGFNGGPTFRKGAEGARALFRHVREGGAVLILVDQRAGGAPLVDFMGREAETSLAAAQLARTLKAPLLTAFSARAGDGFRVAFEPPVPVGTPIEMMGEVNRRIAAWVDADPGQWFWLHRRWRVRRTGPVGGGRDARAYGTRAGAALADASAPEPAPATGPQPGPQPGPKKDADAG